MQLNEQQKQKLHEKLNEKWHFALCPVCQSAKDYQIHERIYELREYNRGSLVGGVPIIPLAVLSCPDCGNTLMMNAIALGVIDPTHGGWIDGES